MFPTLRKERHGTIHPAYYNLPAYHRLHMQGMGVLRSYFS